MYQGNYTNQRRPRRRKLNRSFVLLVSCLILLSGIAGSLAYLITNTTPVANTFTPGRVSCAVIEPGWENRKSTVKENVTVENTGNTDAFIRAAIVATWVDEAGNISATPVAADDYTLTIGTGWTQYSDGYYYYNASVAPGGETSVLVTTASAVEGKAPAGYTLCIEILADAIQSAPAEAIGQSWGVRITQDHVTDYDG